LSGKLVLQITSAGGRYGCMAAETAGSIGVLAL